VVIKKSEINKGFQRGNSCRRGGRGKKPVWGKRHYDGGTRGTVGEMRKREIQKGKKRPGTWLAEGKKRQGLPTKKHKGGAERAANGEEGSLPTK